MPDDFGTPEESADAAAPAPDSAGDDADAPVLPDVGAPCPPSGTTEAAPPTTLGGPDVAAEPEERWWLEPSEIRTISVSDTHAASVVAPEAPSASPEPISAFEWEAAEEPVTHDEHSASPATDSTWPAAGSWNAGAAAVADHASSPAQPPTTLPDLRPPTPPASLFARIGPGASASHPGMEAASPESAPSATEAEPFTPWAFQPPAAPVQPSTVPTYGADFWSEPRTPEVSDGSESAPTDSLPVDENWASPGFVPTEATAPAFDQPYGFGADAPAPYDPTPQSSGPSVDWYEAAALEAVGTTQPEPAANTEFIGYEDAAPAAAPPDEDAEAQPVVAVEAEADEPEDAAPPLNPWTRPHAPSRISSSTIRGHRRHSWIEFSGGTREPFEYELTPHAEASR